MVALNNEQSFHSRGILKLKCWKFGNSFRPCQNLTLHVRQKLIWYKCIQNYRSDTNEYASDMQINDSGSISRFQSKS